MPVGFGRPTWRQVLYQRVIIESLQADEEGSSERISLRCRSSGTDVVVVKALLPVSLKRGTMRLPDGATGPRAILARGKQVTAFAHVNGGD